MFKTIIAYIKVALALLATRKRIKSVEKLFAENKTKEADTIVNAVVPEWAKKTFEITKSTIKVIGEENVPKDGACVFIANHQSILDIPVLLGYINKPKAFIAKIEILKIPLLSRWMKFMHCTFLARKNVRQSIEAMREAIENVKRGYSLVIFPEGTRSRGGQVKEFKPGSFKLAYQSNAPIVPVTIDGTWHLYEEKGHLDTGDVIITIHPPINTAGLEKEQRLVIPAKVQKTIADAIPKEHLLLTEQK